MIRMFLTCCALFTGLALCSVPTQAAEPEARTQQRTLLPAPETWINHVHRDLMPFWLTPEAIGEPVGTFPTFRYRDGSIVRATDLAPWREDGRTIAEADPVLARRLQRNYTRMLSRQTFAYGVAFHLTGDPVYLNLAKAGTETILQRMDPITGVASWTVEGEPEPDWRQRNSQDLAYALLGPAFVYYLTRESWLLTRIRDTIDFIQRHYGDREDGLVRWVLEDFEDLGELHAAERLELVAVLDQINAYLLLLARSAPERDRQQWQARLQLMAIALIVHFHDEERDLFWGRIDAPGHRQLGARHVDFGHTVKAYWMLERIARTVEDEILQRWVEPRLGKILHQAWLEDIGAWGDSWKADGDGIHRGRVWWSFAEMNQAAATLALRNPEWNRKLARSYRYWLNEMVDPLHGEVWSGRGDGDFRPPLFKANNWKNGYHSLEHALVAYITTAFGRQQPVELYFSIATDLDNHHLQPYFFDGRIIDVRTLPREGARAPVRQVITFERAE